MCESMGHEHDALNRPARCFFPIYIVHHSRYNRRVNGNLRQYRGLWTLLWKDSHGKRRQKLFGRVDTVSELDARGEVNGFLQELKEYGDPIELKKIKWLNGYRVKVGWPKTCVFCGVDTRLRFLGYAACSPCADVVRDWDFQTCLECHNRFPIIRDDMNRCATIRYCYRCEEAFLCR